MCSICYAIKAAYGKSIKRPISYADSSTNMDSHIATIKCSVYFTYKYTNDNSVKESHIHTEQCSFNGTEYTPKCLAYEYTFNNSFQSTKRCAKCNSYMYSFNHPYCLSQWRSIHLANKSTDFDSNMFTNKYTKCCTYNLT